MLYIRGSAPCVNYTDDAKLRQFFNETCHVIFLAKVFDTIAQGVIVDFSNPVFFVPGFHWSIFVIFLSTIFLLLILLSKIVCKLNDSSAHCRRLPPSSIWLNWTCHLFMVITSNNFPNFFWASIFWAISLYQNPLFGNFMLSYA